MRWVALIAALGLATAGCGYADDNPRAAAIVAQAYLDALTERDPAAICRLVAPEVQIALAGGRTCAEGLSSRLGSRYPRLRVGLVREIPAPAGNPRYAVEVLAESGREITVGRYGSIWRVVDGGQSL